MQRKNDLLSCEEAADVLLRRITAQAVRKRVRDGELKCHWQEGLPGRIFVKRGELEKLYAKKLRRWRKAARAK